MPTIMRAAEPEGHHAVAAPKVNLSVKAKLLDIGEYGIDLVGPGEGLRPVWMASGNSHGQRLLQILDGISAETRTRRVAHPHWCDYRPRRQQEILQRCKVLQRQFEGLAAGAVATNWRGALDNPTHASRGLASPVSRRSVFACFRMPSCRRVFVP